jgi:formylglycine-generating enzyme required for sulfatase activity
MSARIALAGCFIGSILIMAGTSLADDQALAGLLKTFVEELVEITPGEGKFPKSFQMGSEKGEMTERPVHKVTLKVKFSIAKYEVPQNLYEAVMGENPSKWKGKRNSVEMMTHGEAIQFCEKLTKLLHEQKLIAADERIRLPTEAEWENCCRAGTTTEYSFGDEATKEGDAGAKASLLDEYGWHTGNAAGNDPPVGAKKPNPWGLYDMHGYLWEFTSDEWTPDFTEGQKSDSTKIALRSGSWKNKYPDLRSAARIGFPRDGRDDAVGFRCVKSKTNAK